ncbi:MAG: succinate dehydrogenase cytochrome b subunit [Verrucomicrobia bacterium]|nr:succinate dehydrogenase cytochrome b subunit [Verrucomicrobiota bacterium]
MQARRATPIVRYAFSAIGRKVIMAVTGLALTLFLLLHMLGNLQLFVGSESINRYAHFLHSNLELLWPARIFLLLCLCLHIWSAVSLALENKRARPVGYEGNPVPPGTTLAARTMMYTGLAIAAFVIYHLLHFTVRAPAVNFAGQDFHALKEALPWGEERADVYRMVALGFHQPVAVLIYLAGVGLLCFHLSHGLSAMFQSLGVRDRNWRGRLDRYAVWFSWLLFLGYAAVPAAVISGWVK